MNVMDESFELEINESMPGWFLRKGVQFSGKLQEGRLYEISPLVYSYMDDEEIFSFFDNVLSDTGSEHSNFDATSSDIGDALSEEEGALV